MGGFPALPSGNNPYASEASGYAHAAATVYDRLQSRLQSAAHQHALALQKQEDDTRKRSVEDAAFGLNAIKAGGLATQLPPSGDTGTGKGTPAPMIGTMSGGGGTLQQSLDNPAVPVGGKGQTISDASGKKYYMRTDEEQGKAFIPTGGLAGALQSGGAWDGKTPITPTHSHALMQALNEVAKQHAEEGFDLDTSGKFRDAQGNPMAVAIGRKTKNVTPLNMGGGAQSQAPAAAAPGGTPGGPFAAPAQAPTQPAQPAQGGAATPAGKGGGITFAPPEKAERPDTQSLLPSEFQGAGGGPIVWNKNTQEATELPLPKGTKRALTTQQQQQASEFQTRMAEVGENRAARDAARQQQVQNELAQHNKLKGNREETAKKDFTAAMKDAVTPEEKLAAARAYKSALQSGQAEYKTNISTTLQKPIADNDWADKLDVESLAGVKAAPTPKTPTAGQTAAPTRQTPPATQPAQGAQQPAAKAAKTATLANVRAYAAANKITEAEAVRRVKAEGYAVGQ
jgi:hypothetical protein